MRYRWLRQLDSIFNIGGAEAGFLVDGASTFFLERKQDSAASGISDGVQKAIEIVSSVGHDQEG